MFVTAGKKAYFFRIVFILLRLRKLACVAKNIKTGQTHRTYKRFPESEHSHIVSRTDNSCG